MKKALVAIALAAFASSAFAAVSGSQHDLSTGGPWGTTLGSQLSACQYCHAPHNVNSAMAALGAPLWNRRDSASTFTMYSSATLRNPRANTPNANSMTCLSCHDGATDMGATYTGAAGFSSAQRMAGNTNFNQAAVVGTNLQDDHPVSVQYRYTANGAYAAETDVATAGLKLYAYNGANYVECATCHDPHAPGATADFQPFLRASKTTMCTKCHLY